jgi:ADP-glucose pyrophosphorylase
VGKDVEIMDSILLPYAKVQNGSVIHKTIVGENAEIMSHCQVGVAGKNIPDQEGITVIEDNYIVPEDSVIEEGRNIGRIRAI